MKKKYFGFTMIELLIVIVILGILSVIGLGAFTSAQTKSRDSHRKSSLSGIATALEVYYNDYGGYPTGSASGDIEGCGVGGVVACSYGSIWQDDNGTTYMVQIPEDAGSNLFFYDSNGTSYIIYARLENVHDKAVPQSGGAPGVYSAVLAGLGCGGEGCNYGIASSNTTLGAVVPD
ncbi:type II secretion system GspH family protein [Patescibacteria group bacterium]|nr:type II secretion system GspH family protein [Patescibacteria group bacterium]